MSVLLRLARSVRRITLRTATTTSVLGLLVTGASAWLCANNESDCDRKFDLIFQPTGGGHSIQALDVCASGPHPSTPPTGCDKFTVWDLPGPNTYLQYLVGPAATCVPTLDGQLLLANVRYIYTGLTLRDLGTGTGPFGSGTYVDDSGGDGTFEVFD